MRFMKVDINPYQHWSVLLPKNSSSGNLSFETPMQIITYPHTHIVQNFNPEPVLATLGSGGLILYPTDTIWAIGCDATQEAAVNRVITLKQWDYTQPFVILVSSMAMLKQYVHHIHPRIETLLAYHSQPLTIVYDKATGLPPNALGKDGSVSIRVVHDDFCRSLIEYFGKPLVATSAHIGQQNFPNHFGEISSTVIQGVDLVVRHRQLDKEMGPPSVIARLGDDGELAFIRE